MYQLKRFKFREWREIHSEVNGHNTLHVLLRLCFIFDLGLRLWSKSHLSSCTVLRFKSQSSPGVHELDSFLMKSNWSMDSRRASIKLLLLGAALFMGSDQKSFEVTSHPVLLGRNICSVDTQTSAAVVFPYKSAAISLQIYFSVDSPVTT